VDVAVGVALGVALVRGRTSASDEAALHNRKKYHREKNPSLCFALT
jgi:hypothetical protein